MGKMLSILDVCLYDGSWMKAGIGVTDPIASGLMIHTWYGKEWIKNKGAKAEDS